MASTCVQRERGALCILPKLLVECPSGLITYGCESEGAVFAGRLEKRGDQHGSLACWEQVVAGVVVLAHGLSRSAMGEFDEETPSCFPLR